MDSSVVSVPNNKRRLSVSIVETEEQQQQQHRRRNVGISLAVNDRRVRRNGPVNSTRTIDNDDEDNNYNAEPSMTQDCIEWDEGRHNIDLRKLADPNFQTPRSLQQQVPNGNGDSEDTTQMMLSTSPKLSCTSSTASRSDSRSPIIIPRRRLRRRESLDTVTTGKLIPQHDTLKPYNNNIHHQNETENDPTIVNAGVVPSVSNTAAAIVTTERHSMKRQFCERPPLQDVTNGSSTTTIHHNAITGKLKQSKSGTTDFDDLLQKIQQNTTNPDSSCGSIATTTNCSITSAKMNEMDAISVNHALGTTLHVDTGMSNNNVQRLTQPVVPFLLTTSSNENNVCKKSTAKAILHDAVTSHDCFENEFDDVHFSMDDIATLDAAMVDQRIHTKDSNLKEQFHGHRECANDTKLNASQSTNPATVTDDKGETKKFLIPLSSATTTRTKGDFTVDEENDPFGEIPDINIDALVASAGNNSDTTSPIPSVSNPINTITTETSLSNKNDDYDPFGDIPDIDIDALVKSVSNHTDKSSSATAINPINTRNNEASLSNKIEKNFGDIPDLHLDALVPGPSNHTDSSSSSNAFNPLNTTNTKTCPSNENDDPFGDIPDIDFDAIVHANNSSSHRTDNLPNVQANNSTKDHDFVLPTMTNDDDDDDEFPDVDFDSLDIDACTLNRVPMRCAPATNAPIRNPRHNSLDEKKTTYLTCSRYKVMDISENRATYTKTVSLAEWTKEMLFEEDQNSRLIHHPSDGKHIDKRINKTNKKNNKLKASGEIFLRGEWYYTSLRVDDTIHIVSLTGRFRTDILPITFHTCLPPNSDVDDDLLLVVHPDMLLTPTVVSETVDCPRRAVLKSRLGATGITSRPALFGTMRHALFEATMKSKDFSKDEAISQVRSIVRTNAESLLACNVSSREAEQEVIKFLPQLQRFAEEYTELKSVQGPTRKGATLESHGATKSINFVAKSVEAVEEPVISPELGLKGNVDMLVEALLTTSNQNQHDTSIMGIELKTGHNQQAQKMHVAQLALYIIMLQTRYGTNGNKKIGHVEAANSGMLLYMNNEMFRALHIAPAISDIKSLIGMRNVAAIETTRSLRPRGITLTYEGSESHSTSVPAKVNLLEACPTELPDMLPNSYSCTKCYTNRECMMYTSASRNILKVPGRDRTHSDLLHHFTRHLVDEEYEYFTKWDRLIDLEADASSSLIARAWLQESADLESEFSTCISSLRFDETESNKAAVFDESWFATIAFKRCKASTIQTPLLDVGFETGCRVVVGIDSTSIPSHGTSDSSKLAVRPLMHMARGTIHKATETHIYVLASNDDLNRIEKFTKRPPNNSAAFRMDKENYPTGITTLRQNMVNLFTADKKRVEVPGTQVEQSRLSWLRDVLIRLRKPHFDRSLVKSMFSPKSVSLSEPIPGCDLMDLCFEFAALNRDQQSAVEQIISSSDYTLVQGLPGSGKTSTIAFVARLLAARGKRVLVTSYTHAAVDNVILKLIECGVAKQTCDGIALVRVGKKASCHTGVHSILASEIALELETTLTTQQRQFNTPTSEYLRIAMSNARIVGVTALSIPRSPLLFREHFDVVIVDEAGQISQPAIIGALLAADSFILVGDHMQLPPLVVSELAEIGDYGTSMLKRLADKHPDSVSQLTYQYRMHEDICQLSNIIVYDGKLKCANDVVAKQKLTLTGYPNELKCLTTETTFSWLCKCIDPSNAVTFLDTDKICLDFSNSMDGSICPLESSRGRRAGGSIINEAEALIVEEIIQGFLHSGMDTSSIGIICPFRAQLRLLDERESILRWKKAGLEASTIDRFQGRDKAVIILSFVRSNIHGKVGHLLEDFRRLNVAVTRAKYKLIMVGSFTTLHKGSDVLKAVLDKVSSDNQLVQLPTNTLTFTK